MSSLRVLGQRWTNLKSMVDQHGGWWKAMIVFKRTDDLKAGKLVGEDQFGNKYYENNYYFKAADRWVIYNEKYTYDYDGSMIPAEWFGWMHHKVDLPPTLKKPIHYDWMQPHTGAGYNQSGTKEAYVPYSTVKPKIQAWVPPSAPKKE